MTPQRISLAQLKYHWKIYFFALPSFAMIALFQYYPALSGAFHSFFRWNGADINEFVGLENYVKLLKNEQLWQSFRVALIIGVWNIVKMIPAIAVASTVSVQKVLFVLIFFFVQQQLENHILVPKIMSRQVGVSAVTVIIALLIGGSLAGMA